MTTKFNGTVKVEATGTACNGPVAWESPFVVFTTNDGQRITWHSDSVAKLVKRFMGCEPCMICERFVNIRASLRVNSRGQTRVARMMEMVDL